MGKIQFRNWIRRYIRLEFNNIYQKGIIFGIALSFFMRLIELLIVKYTNGTIIPINRYLDDYIFQYLMLLIIMLVFLYISEVKNDNKDKKKE